MRKGFCKNGHDFNEVPTRLRKDGSRECVICRNKKKKEWADAHRTEIREYDRIYGQKKRADLGAEPKPERRGVGTKDPRPADPAWHNRLPVEPMQNWLQCRVEEWFAEWGGPDWMKVSRLLGVSDRLLRRVMRGLGNVDNPESGVALDSVDRILLEAGETHALELMYPLEGLRETADYRKTTHRRTGRYKGKVRRRKARRGRNA